MVEKLRLVVGTIGIILPLSLVTVTLESLFIDCICCLSKVLNIC